VIIPGEVFLPVGVFYVKPDNIVGNVKFVELPVDIFDILIRDIIPSALVVPKGEGRWQLSVTCQLALLLRQIGRRGAHHDKNVQKTTF
jgi:hypothetical protein